MRDKSPVIRETLKSIALKGREPADDIFPWWLGLVDDCLLVVHAVERTSFVAKVCLMELPVSDAYRCVICYPIFMITSQIGDNIPVSVPPAIVHNWIDIIQTVSAFVLRLQGSADFLIPDQVPAIKRYNVLPTVCARRTIMSRRKGSRNFRVYNIRNSIASTQYAFQRWGYFFAISDAASFRTLSAHEESSIVADSMFLSSMRLTSV